MTASRCKTGSPQLKLHSSSMGRQLKAAVRHVNKSASPADAQQAALEYLDKKLPDLPLPWQRKKNAPGYLPQKLAALQGSCNKDVQGDVETAYKKATAAGPQLRLLHRELQSVRRINRAKSQKGVDTEVFHLVSAKIRPCSDATANQQLLAGHERHILAWVVANEAEAREAFAQWTSQEGVQRLMRLPRQTTHGGGRRPGIGLGAGAISSAAFAGGSGGGGGGGC